MKTKRVPYRHRSHDESSSLEGPNRFGSSAWALLLSFVVGFFFMCNVAQAQNQAQLFQRIDEGFRLWTQETWNGNGRTCSTCHIPAEAYNIFPATIKRLGKTDKDLVFATNVPGLENIDLVRSHALFNILGSTPCGADEPECWEEAEAEGQHPGPIFRSTMGVFGLEITSTNNRATFPGTPLLPAACSDGVENQLAQLGWSGDGSPGTPKILPDNPCQVHHGFVDPAADGSIRAFCNGAIAQHHTKSLERIPGVDFRLPTENELAALDAFQRWLGRRPLTAEENAKQGTSGAPASEFVLNLLKFKDSRVALGRDHYIGPAEFAGPGAPSNPNAGAGCNACHNNAGAKSVIAGPPENININTDVELGSDDIGLAVVGVALPFDEGASDIFGPRRAPTFEDAFNIQSVIEASQKKGWFHNHRAIDDFEKAIAFYISEDFTTAGAGIFTSEAVMRNGNASGSIRFPKGDGIEHLGAFLRALNAFYNLRDCERLLDEAIQRIGMGISSENPIRHCRFNLSYVQRVLSESKLPKLHLDVQVGAALNNATLKLLHKPTAWQLKLIKAAVRVMRNSIAIQTSPPPAS